MLTRTKFFLLLFVLHYPPSLLIPLSQHDVATTSNPNNLMVLRSDQIEQIFPNNSSKTETIQQIDVKDDENQVISNISHVVVRDEIIPNNNNGTLNNGTNNVPTGNANSILNNTAVTNPSNNSSPLLLTKSLNATSGNAKNTTIQGLQNNPANETKMNALNSTYNANVNNATIKEVSTSNVNVSSTIVPYISGGTTSSINNENVRSLNNNSSFGLENGETEVPSLKTIDGKNTLHESVKDAEVELAWRSDIPVGRNKTKNAKHIVKLDSQNVTFQPNNINGSVSNRNSDLFDSENDEKKSIFVIFNSGNIDGLSVNSPVNSGNLQTNSDNKPIENLNSSNSKILNNLINSTINDVLSKILQQNHRHLNATHIFLLLNSGSITNVHVSSPVLENIVKNTTIKDRLRRHLNESNTNNTNVESVTLKPSTDKSNHIIDVKFRTAEHLVTQMNVNKDNNFTDIPLDTNQNNSSLGSNTPATLANSNATVVDLIKDEEISSAEAPTFRSLIPDKIRKLQQVSKLVHNELNETKDHNLVLKLSPESPPLTIDLNQIPINNLLGGALNFIKRLKRNTHDKSENSYPWKTNCKTKQTDENHTVKYCKKSKSFNNDLTIETLPTRKTFDDNISNLLNLYDSVELVCPLSFIVKLYTQQVLDNLAKNEPDSVLNKILISFMNGNEDAINLVSKELSVLPIPVKLRLQLVHGKSKEFMEQLSEIVDTTLCSLS